jgi:signal transduction histidine kinase
VSGSAAAHRRLGRLRVGQWLAITIGVLLAFAVTGIGLALLANHRLDERRHEVLDQVEPSLLAALKLESSLIDEETGVRGYLITAEPRFLEPYEQGLTAEASAYRELAAHEAKTRSTLRPEVQAVRSRVQAWKTRFVAPALRQIKRTHAGSVAASVEGKALFDAVRASLARMHDYLSSRLSETRQELLDDANYLRVVLLVAGALILLSVLGAWLLIQRIITRPLVRLGHEAGHVAKGQFDETVAPAGGAREIVELGEEIEVMRRRIVRELTTVESAREQLEIQALELQRSNAELEQFAYVASHDLQEPLRKIASFCQALERRYHGQLDARADQYIEFAVDGAARMQTLINDLLAFSRVGRSGREHELIDLNELVAETTSSLSKSLEETGASVEVEGLPIVSGERALLVSLFQNLITNAVKFRGADPSVVRLAAQRRNRAWEFSCSDNGIGIEPEYADRIFVIFQRLHTKDAYPGTGIGLALCRKIVEYHGGRMWLNRDYTPGAEFRFTLPIAEEADQ